MPRVYSYIGALMLLFRTGGATLHNLLILRRDTSMNYVVRGLILSHVIEDSLFGPALRNQELATFPLFLNVASTR